MRGLQLERNVLPREKTGRTQAHWNFHTYYFPKEINTMHFYVIKLPGSQGIFFSQKKNPTFVVEHFVTQYPFLHVPINTICVIISHYDNIALYPPQLAKKIHLYNLLGTNYYLHVLKIIQTAIEEKHYNCG